MINNMEQLSFFTKHGLYVWVRPLRHSDAPLLVDVFEHMGSESRYRRFQTPVDNPSPSRVWETAEQIARIPDDKQLGLVAFVNLPDEGDVPAGVARYVVVEPGVAEAAMSVRDDLQNQGIGSHLLSMLVEKARERGIRGLVASVQNSNESMWRLFEKLPYRLKRTLEGNSSNIYLDLTERVQKPEEE